MLAGVESVGLETGVLLNSGWTEAVCGGAFTPGAGAGSAFVTGPVFPDVVGSDGRGGNSRGCGTLRFDWGLRGMDAVDVGAGPRNASQVPAETKNNMAPKSAPSGSGQSQSRTVTTRSTARSIMDPDVGGICLRSVILECSMGKNPIADAGSSRPPQAPTYTPGFYQYTSGRPLKPCRGRLRKENGLTSKKWWRGEDRTLAADR